MRSALITSGLLWTVWLFVFFNTWFPSWFNQMVMQPWGVYWEMSPFWQKFITVVSILLAAMAVVTFVLELVGAAHARREAEGLTRLVGIDVQLPEDVRNEVAARAARAGITEAQLISDIVTSELRVSP